MTSISGFSSSGGGGFIPSNTPGTATALDGLTGVVISGEQREIQYVKGSSGAIVNTVNPQVASGSEHGQEILLVGASDTDTITFDQNNGLFLNGACTLRDGSTLLLYWDEIVWLEISRNDK